MTRALALVRPVACGDDGDPAAFDPLGRLVDLLAGDGSDLRDLDTLSFRRSTDDDAVILLDRDATPVCG